MLLHHDAHCRGTLLRRHDFASPRDECRTGNTNRAPLDTLPEMQLFLTIVLFPFFLLLSLSLSFSPPSLRGRFIERVNILVARDWWHPVTRRNGLGCLCYFNDSLFGRVAAEACVLGERWWRGDFLRLSEFASFHTTILENTSDWSVLQNWLSWIFSSGTWNCTAKWFVISMLSEDDRTGHAYVLYL